MAVQWAVFIAVACTATFLARDSLVVWFIDADMRQAATERGDWSDLAVRQQVRTMAACLGRTRTLRLLGWVGIGGGRSDDALGCAAFHGRLDAVKILVAGGADVNVPAAPAVSAREAQRQTALQQAVRTPAGLPVAEWLLAHGAQPRPPEAFADPVQTAAAAHCLACVEWLRARDLPLDGTSPSTPLALWLDQGPHDGDGPGLVAHLIDLGMSPTAVGADGRSALHAAAAGADGAAVDLLLSRGADPALADHDGMTPLFYAGVDLFPSEVNPDAATQARRERRIAVIQRLLAVTPSLLGQGTPAQPPHPEITGGAYITRPYDFGMTAAKVPAIREAAAQAGKPIRYTDASFVSRLPEPEARALLARMDDAELAGVMPPPAYLTGVAAKAGWWPELARAMQGWPRPRPFVDARVWPACDLLGRAAVGAKDASAGAAESWAVVIAWLDAGMKPVDCGTTAAAELRDAIALRSRVQQAAWQARKAAAPRDFVRAP